MAIVIKEIRVNTVVEKKSCGDFRYIRTSLPENKGGNRTGTLFIVSNDCSCILQ